MATSGRTSRTSSLNVSSAQRSTEANPGSTSPSTAQVWRVIVEWAFDRPPTPANLTHSLVTVVAETATEAQAIAAQMVACRPQCTMPTRTEIDL